MLLATSKIQVTNPTTTADKLEISREILCFVLKTKIIPTGNGKTLTLLKHVMSRTAILVHTKS